MSIYKIIAGELSIYDESSFEQTRRISDYIIHPDYNSNTVQNDICLLTLDSPLELNDQVKAISLDKNEPVSDTLCKVSGWGSLYVRIFFLLQKYLRNLDIFSQMDRYLPFYNG